MIKCFVGGKLRKEEEGRSVAWHIMPHHKVSVSAPSFVVNSSPNLVRVGREVVGGFSYAVSMAGALCGNVATHEVVAGGCDVQNMCRVRAVRALG